MLKETYKGYSIYGTSEKYIVMGKDIIDKKYLIEDTYKNDKRSLVLKIKWKNKSHILKSPLNESRRFLKKVKTLFKKSEVLTTLINIDFLRKNGLEELYIPYLAIEKRKNGMIEESYIVTEFIEGKVIKNYIDFKLFEKEVIVRALEKVHKKGIYHGDANHGNFIFTDFGLRIIDTTGKKECFSNYKKNYDFITLDDCIKDVERFHEYKKYELSYWFALGIKKFKKKFR
ncbi:MAG: lipopolysaccharide core heptose(II) kinase RfaY [Cetobacterium sp.]|uniref:lipopolysaccharide core heptose(II) kinase RfaY n=1 Tax=Cetobacterium sp. TaxID=2071632 RepID=UPI003F40CF36